MTIVISLPRAEEALAAMIARDAPVIAALANAAAERLKKAYKEPYVVHTRGSWCDPVA